MAQKRNSAQTKSQTGVQPPFKYSSSLSREQIALAKATAKKGRRTLNTVNQKLIEWGNDLLALQRDMKTSFNNWLAHYFPDKGKEAQQAMAIAGLGNRLPQHRNEMQGLSRSALLALSQLKDDLLVTKMLVSGVKLTVRAIKEEERRRQAEELDPQACATEKDWQLLVWDKYELEESDRDSLRECASNLARADAGEGETEIEVKVGHILAAVERYKEVLLPKLSHRRAGKSGAAPVSIKDYNELMDILQRQRTLMRELKEEKIKLQEEDRERDQKALEWARQEVGKLWERQKASLQAQLRQVEEQRKQLAEEKEALEAEIASLKASGMASAKQENSRQGLWLCAAAEAEEEEEGEKFLVAQLRRSEEEKEQLIQEKEALEAEIVSLKASCGIGSDSDAGADKKIEADPQEVEEVTACFETVFGSQAVRKVGLSDILSSLEKPVLETLQLLAEGLRRQAKFFQPYGSGNTRQKAPEFDDDFAFDECQIPPEWEPL